MQPMNEAVMDLHRALVQLCDSGFALRGNLEIIRPMTPGLMVSHCTIALGEKMATLTVEAKKMGPKEEPVQTDMQSWKAQGYTGNTCTCGSHRMVRNGTCEKCLECGSTSGCS